MTEIESSKKAIKITEKYLNTNKIPPPPFFEVSLWTLIHDAKELIELKAELKAIEDSGLVVKKKEIWKDATDYAEENPSKAFIKDEQAIGWNSARKESIIRLKKNLPINETDWLFTETRVLKLETNKEEK